MRHVWRMRHRLATPGLVDVTKHTAKRVGDLGFDSQAGQIGLKCRQQFGTVGMFL